MKELYPRSQIDIYIQVIQSDGSNIAASINAATLALIDAGVPMRDFVCACSTSYVQENFLADINYLEESSGVSRVTLGMLPKSEKVVFFQMDSRLHKDNLETLIETTKAACLDVWAVLKEAVKEHSHKQAITLVV